NACQRITRTSLLGDPLLFRFDNFEQQFSIGWARPIVLQVLFVSAIVERFAGLGVELLSLPAADFAIEFNIGSVQFGLTGLQRAIEPFNQSRDFIAIKIPVVVIEVIEIWSLIV